MQSASLHQREALLFIVAIFAVIPCTLDVFASI
jgi:hypothetical protein